MRWDYLLLGMMVIGAFLILTDPGVPDQDRLSKTGIPLGESSYLGTYTFSLDKAQTAPSPIAGEPPQTIQPFTKSGRTRINTYIVDSESGVLTVAKLAAFLEAGMASSEVFFTSDSETLSKSGMNELILPGSTEPSFFHFTPWRSKSCSFGDAHFKVINSVLSVDLKSEECDITLKMTADKLDMKTMNQRASIFTILTNFVTLSQYRSIIRQLDAVDVNNQAQRISIMTIFFHKLGDVIETFSLLLLGMMGQTMFGSFASSALLKFLMFSVLQARLVIMIWKAQLGSQDISVEDLRLGVQRLYSRFHFLVLCSLLLLLTAFDYFKIWVVLYQLYWLPQIARDIYTGQKTSLSISFILTTGLTRLWFPFYIFAVQPNLFDGKLYLGIPGAPDVKFFVALCIVQFVQMGMMVSQKKKGPRWFVPWRFLPHVYNYYRSVPSIGDSETANSTECVICMVDIEQSKTPTDLTAVTPCGHVFHASCLEQWLEIKMECPTCRRNLPPIT